MEHGDWPLYLSIEDAAAYAGIGRNEFRSMMDAADAPILEIGRRKLVERAGLPAFLRSRQRNAPRAYR